MKIYFHLMVEIELCGCQQIVGYLRSVLIIMPLGFPQATPSNGRAFGVLGSHERWCFCVECNIRESSDN